MNHGPIFLGGPHHVGKTWVRLALSTHPNIAISRRTYLWSHFYDLYGDLGQPANFERCLSAMLQHKHLPAVLKPDPDRIRREFSQGPLPYTRLFALLHEHHAQRLGKSRWGDQLAFIERYADQIFAAYPGAKLIHMIRDPRKWFEVSISNSRLRKGNVGGATACWLYSLGLAERNQRRYPDCYKVVRYEMVVSQPERTLREICAFLGVDFLPSMLNVEGPGKGGGKGSGRPSGLGSSVAQSQEPANAMSKREIAFMQTYAGQDMAAYRYVLKPVQFSLIDHFLYYLLDWPLSRLRMAAWRPS